MESGSYVTLADVQEAASALDCKIDRRWISKYVRLGLLPKQPTAPGLGRGAGRQAIYTPDTPRQVQALIAFRARRGKNLDAVGWDLWFAGHQVEEHYWLSTLIEIAQEWDNVRAALQDWSGAPPTHGGEQLVNAMAENLRRRHEAPQWGPAKRHLGRSLPDFLDVIIAVIAGEYVSPLEIAHDADESRRSMLLLSKGLGVPETKAGIPEGHLRIDAGAIAEALARLANLEWDSLTEMIANMPADDLNVGRYELAVILHSLERGEKGARKQGRSIGAETILRVARTPREQAGLLVGYLMLRQNATVRAAAQSLVRRLVNMLKLQGDHYEWHTD